MLSTSNADRTEAERKRTRYTRLVNGLYVVAIAGLLAGLVLEVELVGSTVYLVGVWAGLLLGTYFRRASPVTIVDERHVDVMRRASSLTICTLVYVGLGVFPVIFVLEAAGRYEMGPTVEGAFYTFCVLALVWGAYYGLARYRS